MTGWGTNDETIRHRAAIVPIADGMSEHLQRLAGEKGFAAGVESVRNEDRALG